MKKNLAWLKNIWRSTALTRIECFGRINLGIIDLSNNPYRIDGTHGFYTNLSIADIFVNKASTTSVLIDSDFKDHFIDVINECLEYLKKMNIYSGVCVSIVSKYNRHIGLGSGTQISMSIVEAFNLEFSLRMSIHEKAKIAGSGGTSGVGVYCFERGGYVLDSGRLFPYEKNSIGPSEKYRFDKLPTLISSFPLPEWQMFLLIPKINQPIEGETERLLFKKYTPIPEYETDEICKWILKGIMPAIIEQNFDSFCYSVDRIMNLGFRFREINHYGNLIINRISALKGLGASGVGMSSFGPTVFGFIDSQEKRYKLFSNVKKIFPDDDFHFTTPRNEGAKIDFNCGN